MENPNEIRNNDIQPAHNAEQTTDAVESESIQNTLDTLSANEPEPVSNENENSTATCPNCGALLESDDKFCPRCGTQVNSDVNSSAVLPNKSGKKKKSKKRLLITLISSVAALAIIIAVCITGFLHYRNISDEIASDLKSPIPSASRVCAKYDSLGPIGKLLFRDKAVNNFVKLVKRNKYVPSSDMLVNTDDLDKYRVYEIIAQSLNISSKDGTNVMTYIKGVLELEQYERYNGLYKCVSVSRNDYSTALDYLSEAGSDDNYYSQRTSLCLAYIYAQDSLDSAKNANNHDVLSTKYIYALSTVAETLTDLFNYGYYSVVDTDSATLSMDTITELTKEAYSAKSSVADITDDLPRIR